MIPRLRLLQKKDTASSVVQRRELAQLLEEGRDASARIRVENVISSDIAVEVMEIVELYCELLLARANVMDQVAFGEKGARARSRAKDEKVKGEMEKKKQSGAGASATGKDGSTAGDGGSSRSLFGFPFGKAFGGGGGGQQPKKTPETPTEDTKDQNQDNITDEDNSYIDPAIDEAATAVFYAWPRFPHDVRELTIVRTLLADRYGKDFMALAQENKVENVRVPERLAKGLRVRPPTQELVDSYLREIAKTYGISWGEEEQGPEDLGSAPPEFVDEDNQHSGDSPDVPSTPGKQQRQEDTDTNPETRARRASETNELNKATPPRGPLQQGKSPVSVAPPAPRTDNPNPRVKVPGKSESETGEATEVGTEPKDASSKKDGNHIPEVDELSRRFAALRR